MKEYNTLLKDTARAEDQMVETSVDHEASRAEFVMQLSGEQSHGSTRNRRIPLIAGAAAMIAVVAAVLFFFTTKSSPLSEPQWIQVGKSAPQLVEFDDGTKVRFWKNSAGRVAQTAPHVGEVTLESGSVDLRVPHTRTTSWHVLAGPYKVAVTGTRFEVKWNHQQQQVRVTVYEGSVLVTGPMLEQGQAVIAHRSLVATPTRSSVQVYPPTDSIEDDTEINSTNVAEPQGGVVAQPVEPALFPSKELGKKDIAAPRGRTLKTSNWLKYAQSGEYDKVASYIRTHGLKQMLRGASPTTHLTLGNAARQARDFNTAQQVYLLLRKQHPSSGAASTAALYMGRMAFDQQHQYAKAIKWFNVYLKEQKSGTLHRETLGRLMEAQIKSGNTISAKQTANTYLTQYPSGPHAGRAKELSNQ